MCLFTRSIKRIRGMPKRYEYLEKINGPEDLRQLPMTELPAVAGEIREYLIDSLSRNPGHFASSMGSVELTIALHYVFNTPYDRIVWDVGHQAYAHKILTGRYKDFGSLRQLGGISGFPNPDESVYDTFTAGHASNSISAALGMSVATELNGDEPRRNVVAVIGDASIAGGLAFEALNNAANTGANLLIILNDNDMSIDRNTGSLNSYLAHITSSKSYNTLRYKAYKGLRNFNLVSDRGKGAILRFNNSLKSLLTHQQNIFEGLNLRYFGPFDGHDIERVVRVLSDIKDMKGPRLLHLRTVKGKGYKTAEDDPAVWHAPGKFVPETGERLSSGGARKPPKFQDVMGNTLTELAERNNRIVGITAAMPSGTSMNIMQQRFPKRVFDVGISEGHAVTFAGGLAKDGMLPYVAIYSSFLQRGYDSIIHDVAIQGLPVTFCIDRAGIVGEDGVTHHGTTDLAYLRPIPGMTIAAPRNEEALRNLLYTTQLPDRKGPWAIRYPRGNGSMVDWETPMRQVEVGRGECLRKGTDVAVLCLGTVCVDALKAAEEAEAQGVSAAVYDMAFLKPLDVELLKEVAELNVPIITVEDGVIDGGLGSAVAEWLSEHGVSRKLVRLGIPDRFVGHGTVAQLKSQCGFDAEAITRQMVSVSKKPEAK